MKCGFRSEFALNQEPAFISDGCTTLTIPSTSRAISVGFCSMRADICCRSLGRGYVWETANGEAGYQALRWYKRHPVMVGGGHDSFGQTPLRRHLDGRGALALRWSGGIVRGNDNYPYGEKEKVDGRRGALPCRIHPVSQLRWGYGALCVRDSLHQFKSLFSA